MRSSQARELSEDWEESIERSPSPTQDPEEAEEDEDERNERERLRNKLSRIVYALDSTKGYVHLLKFKLHFFYLTVCAS